MILLSDILVYSLQMLMLNDLGKNMFPYRIEIQWKRILTYGIAALIVFGVNHIESTFTNIMLIPISYILASVAAFKGAYGRKLFWPVAIICWR